MNINKTLKKIPVIAAGKPVADHKKKTTCLMKLFLLMVYYITKDICMLSASYNVNNILYLSITLQI